MSPDVVYTATAGWLLAAPFSAVLLRFVFARYETCVATSPRSRARRTLELTAEMTAALTSGLAALAMSEEGGAAYCESDGEPDVFRERANRVYKQTTYRNNLVN